MSVPQPRGWRAASIVAAAVLLGAAASWQPSFTGRCVSVIDGDSIEVLARGAAIELRLEGIDAPERSQPFSARAKQALSDLVFAREVSVLGKTTDAYGRLVARVYVGGVDTSLELLRQGLAWHYKRYSSEEALANAESVARARRVGLWADPGAVPPWAYRRPAVAPPVQRALPAHPPSASAGEVRGNTRSRVFHRRGCTNFDCKNCTERFVSAGAAGTAGYRPAGCCHSASR